MQRKHNTEIILNADKKIVEKRHETVSKLTRKLKRYRLFHSGIQHKTNLCHLHMIFLLQVSSFVTSNMLLPSGVLMRKVLFKSSLLLRDFHIGFFCLVSHNKYARIDSFLKHLFYFFF